MDNKKIFWLFALLACLYLGITLATPPDTAALNRYHINEEQIQFLRLTLAVPIVLIWFIAFYGYAKFRNYYDSIKKSKEGGSFALITRGMLFLALWLPVASIMSNISSYVEERVPELTETMTIITNYINLALVFYAFYLLFRGSRGLVLNIKERIPLMLRTGSMAILLILSGLFAYMTLTDPARQFPSGESNQAAYYLPDSLLIPTIIIPYIAVFYMGLSAVQNIHSYRRHVRGVLYKQGLGYLANGIGVVVLSLIVVRYINAFTTQFSSATLQAVLIIIYCLILLIAIGYIIVAYGAKKLQKIEEV